jgi:lipoprotein-anchoring transpeptidase ErfK/SrfK
MSIVAQATVPHVQVFGDPSAATPTQVLPSPRPIGGPLILLVTDQRPGWVKALLPVRPNGTQGWVRTSDVTLFQHDYRIVVELGTHRITVFRGFEVVDQEMVGVGTGATPTPGGLYYTEDFVKLTGPGPYGPYAYGLSGFSNVLTSFGGGPGQLAIHGTDDPAGLGHNVSHGCIRMSNAGVTKLAGLLPLGVPVQVIA